MPLLLLSIAAGGAGELEFFSDIEVHVRFLAALPLLLIGEIYANRQIADVMQQFVLSGVVGPEDKKTFYELVRRIKRIIDANWGEAALLLLTVFWVRSLWLNMVEWRLHSWFGHWEDGVMHYSLPGYWLAYVSMPLFQFVLLRWLYRLCLWFVLLLQLSRIGLNIIPIHPDRMGGLAFLAGSVRAVTPLLLTQGALLLGMIVTRMRHDGKDLFFYQQELIVGGVTALAVSLGPLLVFTGPMIRARVAALQQYGCFSGQYVRNFSSKWLDRQQNETSELLGSADIQSLADLANAYSVVDRMGVVPFRLREVASVLIYTYVLVIPLVFTIVPAEEVFGKLLKILL